MPQQTQPRRDACSVDNSAVSQVYIGDEEADRQRGSHKQVDRQLAEAEAEAQSAAAAAVAATAAAHKKGQLATVERKISDATQRGQFPSFYLATRLATLTVTVKMQSCPF